MTKEFSFGPQNWVKNCLFFMVFLSTSPAFNAQGYEVPWYMGGLPDLVVVGTLNDVVHNVDYWERKDHSRQEGVIRYYMDAGWVFVEEMLEGETILEKIPVIWNSRAGFYPLISGCSVSSTSEQTPPIGEPQVWILFKPRNRYAGFPEQRNFKHYPIHQIENINYKLEKLRKGEPIEERKSSVKIRGRYHMD